MAKVHGTEEVLGFRVLRFLGLGLVVLGFRAGGARIGLRDRRFRVRTV